MCVNLAARLSAIGAGWSVVVLTAACGGNPAPAPNPSASAAPSSTAPMKITDPYSPTIDPAAFSATIDNPYLPMVPGTRTIYEAHTPDGLQQTTTEVTRDTKTIASRPRSSTTPSASTARQPNTHSTGMPSTHTAISATPPSRPTNSCTV